MIKFQPLDMQRAIRSDDQLTTTSEVALLLCAVLRTDNGSRKVRASLALLAKDANCSERTARTAFKNPQVLKYFKRVDRYTRQINLWFYPTPAMVAGVEVGESAESTPAIEDDSGNGCHDSGNGCHDSGNGCRPSAFASASSSAKDSAPVADAPSAHEDEEPTIKRKMNQETATSLNTYKEGGGIKKQEATASSNSKEDEAAEESTNTKTDKVNELNREQEIASFIDSLNLPELLAFKQSSDFTEAHGEYLIERASTFNRERHKQEELLKEMDEL